MPENYTSATLGLGIDTRQFNKELSSTSLRTQAALQVMKRNADAFNDTWKDLTAGIKDTKRIVSGIVISQGFYLLTGALVEGASAALTFSSNMEQAAISMEYFVEGADKANKAAAFLREMNEFAARTPFSTEEALSLSKYMQAVGVSMNTTKSFLQVITDTAAATGATEENMQRIVFALGQMMTKGRIASEEIRQLANANVPIYEILQEELGLTGQQISNIGKYWIDADKATVAILRGLEKRYKGAADRVSDTFGGMMDTIQDNLKIIAQEAGDGLYSSLSGVVRSLRDTLDDYREVATAEGSWGLFEHIMEDIDDTGELRNEIMVLIGSLKNLVSTGTELYSAAKPIIQIYGRSMYVAFTTGAAAVTTLADAADELLGFLNDLGITNDMVVNSIGRLYIAYVAAKWLGTLGQAGMAAAQGLYNTAMGAMSLIPASIRAQSGIVGLTASVLGLVGVLALAYQMFTAFSGAASGIEISGGGVSSEYLEALEQYQKEMDEYNKSIEKYQEDFNKPYESIDDGTDKAQEGLNDVKDTSKKTAASVKKDWVAAFDEVYAVPNDNDSGSSKDKEIKLPDLGALLTPPKYAFPQLITDALEKPKFDLDSIFDKSPTTDWLGNMLPGIIAAGVLGGLGNFFSKRGPVTDITAKKPTKLDSTSSLKTVEKKLTELGTKLDEQLALTRTRYNELLSAAKQDDKYLNGMPKDALGIEGMTEQLKLTAHDLGKMLEEVNKARALKGEAPIDLSDDMRRIEQAINNGELLTIDRHVQALTAKANQAGLSLSEVSDIRKRLDMLYEKRNKIVAATGEVGESYSTYNELIDLLDSKTDTLYKAFGEFSTTLKRIEGHRVLDSGTVKQLIETIADFDSTADKLRLFAEFASHGPSTPGLAALDSLDAMRGTLEHQFKILMRNDGKLLDEFGSELAHIYSDSWDKAKLTASFENRQFKSLSDAWNKLGDINKKMLSESYEARQIAEKAEQQRKLDNEVIRKQNEERIEAENAARRAAENARNEQIDAAARRPIRSDSTLSTRAIDTITLQNKRVEQVVERLSEAIEDFSADEAIAELRETIADYLQASETLNRAKLPGNIVPTYGTAPDKAVNYYQDALSEYNLAKQSVKEQLAMLLDNNVQIPKELRKILKNTDVIEAAQEIALSTAERTYRALKLAARQTLTNSGLPASAAEALERSAYKTDANLKELIKRLNTTERTFNLTGTALEAARGGIGSFDSSLTSEIAKRLSQAGVPNLGRRTAEMSSKTVAYTAALGSELEDFIALLAAQRLAPEQGQIMSGGFKAANDMPAIAQIDTVLKLYKDNGIAFELLANDIKTKSGRVAKELFEASKEFRGTIRLLPSAVLRQENPANYAQFALQAKLMGTNRVGMPVFNRDVEITDDVVMRRWAERMNRTGLSNPFGNRIFSEDAVDMFATTRGMKDASMADVVKTYMQDVIIPAFTDNAGNFDVAKLGDAFQQYIVEYPAEELAKFNFKGISNAYAKYGQLVTLLSNNRNITDFMTEWVVLSDDVNEAIASVNFAPVLRHYNRMMGRHNKWLQEILQVDTKFSRGAIGKPLQKAVDDMLKEYNIAIKEAASFDEVAEATASFKTKLTKLADAADTFAKGGELDSAYVKIFDGTQRSMEDMRLLERALNKIADNVNLVSDVPRKMRTAVDGINRLNTKLANGAAINAGELTSLTRTLESLFDDLGLNMSRAVRNTMSQLENMTQVVKRWGGEVALSTNQFKQMELPFKILDVEQSLKYTAGAIKEAIDRGVLKVTDSAKEAVDKIFAEIGPEYVQNSFIGQLRKPRQDVHDFIDIETIGSKQNTAEGVINPRISQIGYYNSETGKQMSWFINWGEDNADQLRQMKGLFDAWSDVSIDQLNNGKDIMTALRELKAIVGDRPVSGFNATNFNHAGGAFDASIIDALTGSGYFNWGPDVMSTALSDISKALGNTHLKNTELAQLLLGSLPDGAHLADTDAMLTGKAMQAISEGKLNDLIDMARPKIANGMPIREALFESSDELFGSAKPIFEPVREAVDLTGEAAKSAAEAVESGAKTTKTAGQIFGEAMNEGRRHFRSFTENLKRFYKDTGPSTGMFKAWADKFRSAFKGAEKVTTDAFDAQKVYKMFVQLAESNDAFSRFSAAYTQAIADLTNGTLSSTDEVLRAAVTGLQDIEPTYKAAVAAYDEMLDSLGAGTIKASDKSFKKVAREFSSISKQYDDAMERVAKAMSKSSDDELADIAKSFTDARKVYKATSKSFYDDIIKMTQKGLEDGYAGFDNIQKVIQNIFNDASTVEDSFKYLAYTIDPKTGAIKLLNDSIANSGQEINKAIFKMAEDMIDGLDASKAVASSAGKLSREAVEAAMNEIRHIFATASNWDEALKMADELSGAGKAFFRAFKEVTDTTVIIDAAGELRYAGSLVDDAIKNITETASNGFLKGLNKALVGWHNFGILDAAGIAIGTGLQYSADTRREQGFGDMATFYDSTGIVKQLREAGVNLGDVIGDALYNGTFHAFAEETTVAAIGAAITTGIVAATGGTAGIAFLGANLAGAAASVGSSLLMQATGSRSDSTLYLDDYIKALRDGTVMTEEMYKEMEEKLGRVLTESERSDIERAARDALNQDLIVGAKKNLWSAGNINQVLYGQKGEQYGAQGDAALAIRSAAALGALDLKALGIGAGTFTDKQVSYEGAEAEYINANQLVVADDRGLRALEEVLNRKLQMSDETTVVDGQLMHRVQYADTGAVVGTVSFDDLDALAAAFDASYRNGGASGDILTKLDEIKENYGSVNAAASQHYGYGSALANANFETLLEAFNSLNGTNYSRSEVEETGIASELMQKGAQIFQAYYDQAIAQLGVAGKETWFNADIQNLLTPKADTTGSVQVAAFGHDLSGISQAVLDDLKNSGITLAEKKYNYTTDLTGETEESYVTVNVDMAQLKDEVRGWTIQPENIDLTGLNLTSDDVSVLASMGIQIDAQNGTIDFMRPINEEVMGAERKLTLNAGDFSQSVIDSLEAYHFKLDFEAGELKIDNWDKVKDNMYGAMFKMPDNLSSRLSDEAKSVLNKVGKVMDSGYLMITNEAILNGSMTIEEYVNSVSGGVDKLKPDIMDALKNIDTVIAQGGEDTKQAIIEYANGIVIPSPLDEDQIDEELRASFAAIGISFQKYGDEFLMVINQTGDHIKDGMVLIDKEKWDGLDSEIKQALTDLGVTMTQEGNNILVDLNGTFANGVDDLVSVWVEQPEKWQQLPDTVKQWLMEAGVVTTDQMLKLQMLTNQGVTQLSTGWLVQLNLLDEQTQAKMKAIFKNMGKEVTDGFVVIDRVVDEADIDQLLEDEVAVPFSELPDEIKKSLGDAANNMEGKYVIMKNSTATATQAMITSWTTANTDITEQANTMADNVAEAVARAMLEADKVSKIKLGSTGGFLGIGATKNTLGDPETIKVDGAEYTGYPEYDKNGKLVKWHYYDSTGKRRTTTSATVVKRAAGGVVDEDITLVGELGREFAILPNGKVKMLGANGPELLDLPRGTTVVPNDETEELVKYVGNGATVRKLADGNAEVKLEGASEEDNQSITEMVAAMLKIMQNGTTLDEPKDGELDPNYESVDASTKYAIESSEIAINGAVAALTEAMYTNTANIIDVLGKEEGFDFSAAFENLSATLDNGLSEISSQLSGLDNADSSAAILEEVSAIRASLDALFAELQNSIIEVKTATSEITNTQLDTVDSLSYEELVQIAVEIAAAREAYLTATTDAERIAAHDAAEAARARAGYSGGADGSQVNGDNTYAELINQMVASLVEMQGSMTLSEATTTLLNDAQMQSSYNIIENEKALHEALVETVQTEGNSDRKMTEATSTAIRTDNTAAHRATEQVISTSTNDLKGTLATSFTGLQTALTDGLNRVSATVSKGLDRAASYGYSNGYSAGYSAGSSSNLGTASSRGLKMTGTEMRWAGGSTVIKANARGGLIEDDTLIRAGEFGRSEAVIPLEQPSIMEDVGATIGSYVDTEASADESLGSYVEYIVTSMEIAINGAVAALTEDKYKVNDQLTAALDSFNKSVDALKTEFGDSLNSISGDISDLKNTVDGITSAISSLGSNEEAAATITAAIETLPDTLAAILLEVQNQQVQEMPTSSNTGLSYDELVGIAADISRARTMYANATTDEERAEAHNLAESARARAGYSGGADGSQVIGDSSYVELITTMVNALTALQESMNLSEATTTLLNDAELQNSLAEIENAKVLAEQMTETLQSEYNNTRKNVVDTTTSIRTDNTNAHRATEQVINSAATDLKGTLATSFTALQTALSTGLADIAATVSAGLDRAAAYGYSNGYSAGYSAGAASNLGSNLGGSRSGTKTKFAGSTTIKSNARGGLISEDTIIRAGEFGRSEAVIPLEQPSIMEDVGAKIGSYVNTEDTNDLGALIDYVVTSMEIAINGAVAALTEDSYTANESMREAIAIIREPLDTLNTSLGDPIRNMSYDFSDLKSSVNSISGSIDGIGSNADAADKVCEALQSLPETMIAVLEQLLAAELEAMQTPTETIPNENDLSQLEAIYQVANEIAEARNAYLSADTDEERAAAHQMAEDARAKLGYSGGADGSELTGDTTYAALTEQMAQIIANQQMPMTLSEVTTALLADNENVNHEQLRELIELAKKETVDRNDAIITKLNTEQLANNTSIITDHKFTMVNTINAIAATLSTQIGSGFASVNATVAAGIDRAASIGYSKGYSAGYSAGAASNLGSNLGSGGSKSSSKGGTTNKIPASAKPAVPTKTRGAAMGGLVDEDALYRVGELGLSEAIVPLEKPEVLKQVGEALGPYISVDQVRLMKTMLGVVNGGIATADTFQRQQAVQETQSVDAIVQKVLESVLPAMSYNEGDNGEDRRPLYVGTLIADDKGLKELERKLYVIRKSEETRR